MWGTLRTFMLVSALVTASAVVQAETTPEPPQSADGLDESARREQAKTLFEKAISLYREERYKEALNYFLGAQNLFPNATLIFNIARTCERLHDAPCALRYYRDYRRKAQDAKDLDEVDRHVASMEHEIAKTGTQQVTLFSKPDGATLLVDGVQKGTTPWTGELKPGQHTALIKQPGFSDLQVPFLVEAAHAVEWSYELQPAASPAAAELAPPPVAPRATVAPVQRPAEPARPAPAEARRARIGTWTWIGLGSGAAVLGTAAILESVRASRESAVRENATQLDRAAAYESMKDYQKAARITAGAGLTLTAVGLTLLTLDLTRHSKARSSLTASCVARDCSLHFSGAW